MPLGKELLWDSVDALVAAFLKVATAPASILRRYRDVFPRVRSSVFYQPETFELHACIDKSASDNDVDNWLATAGDLGFLKVAISPGDVPPDGYGEQPWVLVKQAADPVIATTAKLLNYQPYIGNKIIGGPSPLAAALTSGLLGAGVGYGLGTIGESFLPPSDFNSGTLRRNTAIAGALAAASPALLWGAASHQGHPETPGPRAWLSGWPFREQDHDAVIDKSHKNLARIVKQDGGENMLHKRAWFSEQEEQPLGQGLDQFATMPMIPKDDFGRVVWSDPNTPVHIRAATTGLVNAASYANNNNPFVSPWDIAKVTASGATKGMVVGKTLGVLAGLKPESQANLQRIGVWSGMLSAVVPNAFPAAMSLFRPY